MVFFTCNACGEALKKGQVEKHVNMCRNCLCLSCMDCGKDFWDDDYKYHVKCLSEDQKYGGKNYEAKVLKGDVKQQEWIQKIHEIIKETNINVKVRDTLQQMYVYDNIPRKKRKFQNWMANSLKIHNTTLQDQVWDIFSEATRKETLETQSVKNEIMPVVSENNITKTEKPKEKKSKKELKEKKSIRKLKALQENLECLKSEKSRQDILEEGSIKMPRSNHLKKAKQEAAGLVKGPRKGNGPESEEAETEARVRKRKNSCTKDESPIPTKIMNCFEVEENKDKHRGKFNWKGTIRAVLKQAPDNELSIKKLRKKVIAQYYAVTGDHQKSEEETLALFKKKVSSNPNFRILKEKVKLLK
ncbi:cell growth-regulating nucleolar protein [Pantherophis guttatus]|uniref:Cell growth-regulating nucleolar protein n=1 Tax=Pantherophis guttatus TaxID=94885 RepID=A0A6P9D842_PANGU|nr:cell growth-regulating nucleolar protein [Pantherophis guttatus]XP_034291858.1 cell growth-regulating nucleolar protein [Pantherophis guttatus]